MIRKIRFDSFPEPLSAVCYGCGRLGGDYDDERSFALLDAYYAMGGRFLDTANCYGRWTASGMNESERCIGAWLRSRQVTDMVVTSKCCHYAFDAHDVSRVNRACAEADLEDSRRTLGLDTIPIYLTHRDDPSVDIRVIVDFLADMVKSGRVTRFGLSNYRADRIRAAIDYLGEGWRDWMVAASNEWSLHEECLAMDRGGELPKGDGIVATSRELWKLHRETGLPLFSFSAAAGGFYEKLAAGRVQAGPYDREAALDLARIAEEHRCSVTVPSIAYLLNSGVPAIPIVAVSNASQMADFEAISAWEDDLSALSPFRKG
ncbi:MAG: aldo/keto reductase [Clostridia bacterium]|nr:aldo/keto reductase [Clostridia bacterium]MBR5364611.1 aldo/keto reductase [Clostridia bacterium]